MQYAPTRVHEKPGGFHISAYEYAKNAPDFIHPNRDTPKTHPVLDLNPSARNISERMLLRPTRVREKTGGFHISAHVPAKDAPDFTLPDKDTPKTRPVLYPKPCRRTFRGVCNTPLHGYVKNLTGFIFPYTDTCKICPVSHFRTRIRQKRTRFHPSQ